LATLDTPTRKALKTFSSFPYNISIATKFKVIMFINQTRFTTHLEKGFKHDAKEGPGFFPIVVLVSSVEGMVVLVDQYDALLAMVLS
jgi:hypothetical protein